MRKFLCLLCAIFMASAVIHLWMGIDYQARSPGLSQGDCFVRAAGSVVLSALFWWLGKWDAERKKYTVDGQAYLLDERDGTIGMGKFGYFISRLTPVGWILLLASLAVGCCVGAVIYDLPMNSRPTGGLTLRIVNLINSLYLTVPFACAIAVWLSGVAVLNKLGLFVLRSREDRWDDE